DGEQEGQEGQEGEGDTEQKEQKEPPSVYTNPDEGKERIRTLQRLLGEATVAWAKMSTKENILTNKAAEMNEVERSALTTILFVPPHGGTDDGNPLCTRMEALSAALSAASAETIVDSFI